MNNNSLLEPALREPTRQKLIASAEIKAQCAHMYLEEAARQVAELKELLDNLCCEVRRPTHQTEELKVLLDNLSCGVEQVEIAAVHIGVADATLGLIEVLR
jgi:hypothetical protein